MAWVATAVIGSAVIGAGATAYAANRASEAQQNAANKAANTQLQMYETTRGDLAPYRQIGEQATGSMSNRLDELTGGIDIDDKLNDPNSISSKALAFQTKYGNKAIENSAAARGLGASGAAMRGIADYTVGAANQHYKDLFSMENTNQTNAYNRLLSLIQAGGNAAAQTGQAGTSAAQTAGSAQMAGGNAAAAGYNAMGGAASNAANNIGGYYANQFRNSGSMYSQPANWAQSNPGVAGSAYYGPVAP